MGVERAWCGGWCVHEGLLCVGMGPGTGAVSSDPSRASDVLCSYYPLYTRALNDSVKGNRALLLLLPVDVVQRVKVCATVWVPLGRSTGHRALRQAWAISRVF